jgi:hypothetical protein
MTLPSPQGPVDTYFWDVLTSLSTVPLTVPPSGGAGPWRVSVAPYRHIGDGPITNARPKSVRDAVGVAGVDELDGAELAVIVADGDDHWLLRGVARRRGARLELEMAGETPDFPIPPMR